MFYFVKVLNTVFLTIFSPKDRFFHETTGKPAPCILDGNMGWGNPAPYTPGLFGVGFAISKRTAWYRFSAFNSVME
jgi:hypothetical protein